MARDIRRSESSRVAARAGVGELGLGADNNGDKMRIGHRLDRVETALKATADGFRCLCKPENLYVTYRNEGDERPVGPVEKCEKCGGRRRVMIIQVRRDKRDNKMCGDSPAESTSEE
jgi:hypothetical protein